jgi:flavorubredoxin
MNRLSDHAFITSVLNPGLRTFDIIMHTEYGTSYNSYLVHGKDAVALIDAAHASFCSYYFDNIDATLEGLAENGDAALKPAYLVMNHLEPDHSGCISDVVNRYPDITIVASQAGAINVKNITNRDDLKIRVVKDGDVLDLGGGIELHFISAPFLHWPDTIFTWLPADKVLFTCDFLGAHYCEPQHIDTKMADHNNYLIALREYYDAIMRPFARHVLAGLNKLEALDVRLAATSHGPILTAGCQLEPACKQYREWAQPAMRAQKHIPVFYASAYGNTKKLAQRIARGIALELPDAKVTCYDITEHEQGFLDQELATSDAFCVGSVTINRDAVEPVWRLLTHVDAINLAKRPVALFGSYGWSGEAVANVAERLTSLKAKVFDERFRVLLVPSLDDLDEAEAFGARFARSLGE